MTLLDNDQRLSPEPPLPPAVPGAPAPAPAPVAAPASPRVSPAVALPFAAAMFLGAFLLFLVQPLAGKYLLPLFGGGPAVWTTCMLFFQAVLLAGYAYAHLGVSRLRPRAQAAVHAALLAAAVAAACVAATAAVGGRFNLALAPGAAASGGGQLAPVRQILLLLAAGLGLPCLVLSATSPLLNAWYSRAARLDAPGGAGDDRGVYRLYAVSNLGSLLGLLAYPFAVEPFLPRRVQAVGWAAGLALFAVLCAYCAYRAARAAPGERDTPHDNLPAPGDEPEGEAVARPSAVQKLLWLLLPACASVLLLATTNTMTQDVAAVPFLWVLPLALYLLTFILAFGSGGDGSRRTGYRRGVMGPMLALAAAGVCWVLFQDSMTSIAPRVAVLAAALFVCCTVCHGELAALRPPPRHLTAYYLTIAAGGALGGILVAVVAPLLLVRYVELNVGLWACCALALVVPWTTRPATPRNPSTAGNSESRAVPGPSWAPAIAALGTMLSIAGLVVLGVILWAAGTRFLKGATVVHRARDFYGVLTVYDSGPQDPDPAMRVLFHGAIIHGKQFLDPAKRRLPTVYYGPDSGIGAVMRSKTAPGGRRVGVVGLGAGMMAAHGRAGDAFRFYEISPKVAAVAREQFTYLADSPARCEIVLGDARVSLEREPAPRGFDVLVLDAFSGDSIPVHLLTAEAFALYRRHVAPGGVIAVHISNNHVDLAPVLRRHADDSGWAAVLASSFGGDERYASIASDWVLMAADAATLAPLRAGPPRALPARADPSVPRWTDEYASLLQTLK